MVSDIDRSWAAGFFDGEGTTSNLKTKRDKYIYIRMSISQKNPELLEKFLSIVGMGTIYKSKTRNIYSWNCYKQEEVEKVLDLLWPYLGNQKRQQAQNARNNITGKGGTCGV